jgi:hypothetical protein
MQHPHGPSGMAVIGIHGDSRDVPNEQRLEWLDW